MDGEVAENGEKSPVALWQRLKESPPSKIELIVVVLIVISFDLAVFRGGGFAGYAVWMAVLPPLLFIGSGRKSINFAGLLTGVLVILEAVRLVWSGTFLNVVSGMLLVPAVAMSISGAAPFLPELGAFILQAYSFGYRRLSIHFDALRRLEASGNPNRYLNWLIPAVALVVFGVIFIMANPSLVEFTSTVLSSLGTSLQNWFRHFSVIEVILWFAIGWISWGMIRPSLESFLIELVDAETIDSERVPWLLIPFRNTLVTVILLFAVYLVFEFSTLWFREFPDGFYYAGYAHEGAAWLTIALALATGLLSLIFRSQTGNQESGLLRRLAWIWSVQNFVLAAAVYNRMYIYIDFNGMTRMRTIGLFGITTVVVGFALVLYKISQHRSFMWLIRRQLWALALAIVIYTLVPVDWFVHRYNTDQIMRGQLPPSVQISVHPIDAEGYLALFPLLDCKDEQVREGIAAMLSKKQADLKLELKKRETSSWTEYQRADVVLKAWLDACESEWQQYNRNVHLRDDTIEKFKKYAYQWY